MGFLACDASEFDGAQAPLVNGLGFAGTVDNVGAYLGFVMGLSSDQVLTSSRFSDANFLNLFNASSTELDLDRAASSLETIATPTSPSISERTELDSKIPIELDQLHAKLDRFSSIGRFSSSYAERYSTFSWRDVARSLYSPSFRAVRAHRLRRRRPVLMHRTGHSCYRANGDERIASRRRGRGRASAEERNELGFALVMGASISL